MIEQLLLSLLAFFVSTDIFLKVGMYLGVRTIFG
jgi:hypothetical protein